MADWECKYFGIVRQISITLRDIVKQRRKRFDEEELKVFFRSSVDVNSNKQRANVWLVEWIVEVSNSVVVELVSCYSELSR